MRKFVVTFMASLLSCNAAFAFLPEAADTSFELGVGYRRDKFSWTHEGLPVDVVAPTRLVAKSQWHDLNIWQIDARVKYVTCDNLYFRANADYGWVTSGKFTRKDYVEAGDTSGSASVASDAVEMSNFSVKADKGHVYDATLAIGYQFKMCDDSFALAPVVGYSWNGQHYELGGDNSSSSSSYVVDVAAESSGSGTSRNKFNTRWNGPFLGVDFDYKVWCDWSIFATYEFHWVRYHARTHWRFDPSNNLDGFNQRGKNAHGQVASVGVNYDFCECWTASLIGEWKYFRSNKGQHKELISDVDNGSIEQRCYRYTPLKHATWQSGSITLDVGMLF